MKVFACLAVFLGCVTVGWVIYRRALSRVRFFSGLLAFCNTLKAEISFTLTPLSEVAGRYKNSYSSEFNRTLTLYGKMLDKKCDITRERCLALFPIYLTEQEKNSCADFFYNLGRSGSREERDKIDASAGVFSEYRHTSERYLTGGASIVFKILIIIGIAGVILLL